MPRKKQTDVTQTKTTNKQAVAAQKQVAATSTKPVISKRGRKPAPHVVAKSAPGYEKQVGMIVDARFHNTFKDVCEERGMSFSEVTRSLQEMWLKKQLDKKSASC